MSPRWPKRAQGIQLLMVAAVLAIALGGVEGSYSQERLAAIDPEVLDTLEENTEAAVIISLMHSSPANADMVEVQQDTAQRQARVLSALTSEDLVVTYRYSVVPALAGRISAEGLDELSHHPDVLEIASDRLLQAGLGESVPLIKADDSELTSLGIDGTGVTVAVMDSGIDTDHPDLEDSIVGGKCFLEAHGSDCPAGQFPYEDDWTDVYHGTHVSGIITADGDNGLASRGVAPGAGIFVYKIIGAPIGPFEGQWSTSDMLAALNDIINPNTYPRIADIDLINMSLWTGNTYPPGQCPSQSAAIDVAIEWLYLFGTLTVSIAGNNANKTGISWPACHPLVTSVGAVYDEDLGSMNWGICSDSNAARDRVTCFSSSSDDLTLLAPGAIIRSTSAIAGRVANQAGTSQAAPHAVGVAALLKQVNPLLTPPELHQRLVATGKWRYDLLAERWTPRIDARAALIANDDFGDWDGDGCRNGAEYTLNVPPAGPGAPSGGVRNPLDGEDYFDVSIPRDGVIDLPNDILGVINHSQGGSLPYDVNFDRGLLFGSGPNFYNTGPRDGVIDLSNDILNVVQQYNPGGC